MPEKKRKLLFSVTIKDCIVEDMCSSGPGGQHVNRTHSKIRITHKDSKAVGESQEFKSQRQNKEAAFRRMTEDKRFKLWHKVRCAQLLGQKLPEEIVEEMMKNKQDFKLEIKDENGNWTETTKI